ncbi:hypothetical protein EVAR_82164_1 [Eumeta japonica]|uniref:Uncharacterized protein n=1 Tax=Eumeta variegata TaxID=151549 RepID=A0A4C1U1X9_EUMVA|nr:hypothetical protein EVAR_82164_1 [Eumeta japonica]
MLGPPKERRRYGTTQNRAWDVLHFPAPPRTPPRPGSPPAGALPEARANSMERSKELSDDPTKTTSRPPDHGHRPECALHPSDRYSMYFFTTITPEPPLPPGRRRHSSMIPVSSRDVTEPSTLSARNRDDHRTDFPMKPRMHVCGDPVP